MNKKTDAEIRWTGYFPRMFLLSVRARRWFRRYAKEDVTRLSVEAIPQTMDRIAANAKSYGLNINDRRTE